MIESIAKWRSDTPGCTDRIHMNNAGAALPPAIVIQTMLDYLAEEAREGGYALADAKAQEIKGFYTSIAKLLNTRPSNIAFMSSATDAYVQALLSIPFQAGDVILTTDDDYVANQIAFLSLQKRLGVKVVRAANNSEGDLEVSGFERLVKKHQPKLVAVTHIPTNSGLVQPIEAIGEICQLEGMLYLVDACQSVGQLPLDVKKIGCDFLCGTGRKFLRGPRGTGFLYVSDNVLEKGMEPLCLDMVGVHWKTADVYELLPGAARFERWERNYGLLLGLKAAVDYALDIGLATIQNRAYALATQLRTGLQDLPGAMVLDRGSELCGIVTTYFPSQQPAMLKAKLAERCINSAFATRQNALIDFDKKGVEWAIRLSPHYYNTENEIEQVLVAVQKAID